MWFATLIIFAIFGKWNLASWPNPRSLRWPNNVVCRSIARACYVFHCVLSFPFHAGGVASEMMGKSTVTEGGGA